MLARPILYVTPTPIGNLQDITIRALNILKEVDLIIAEDTRVSKKLLLHYEIRKNTIPYHKFNEHKTIDSIIQKIRLHGKAALISDAGTPGISDAGFLLINKCIAEDIEIQTLPGACALIPALINSGLPSDKFVFEGFLPTKKHRSRRLEAISREHRTIILYESPHKLIKTLNDCIAILGKDRLCSISREITKIFEETKRGSLEELLLYFSNKKIKGEFVICIQGIEKETKHEIKKNREDF